MGPGAIMAVKGGVGAISGGVNAYQKNESNKATLRELIKQGAITQKQIDNMSAAELQTLANTYAPQLEGFEDNTQAYFDKLKNFDATQYNVSAPEEFTYDLNAKTKEFLNPELETITTAAARDIEGSSANAGKLFSGAAGRAIARSTADITAKEYKTAQAQAQQDKATTYQAYMDKFNNAMKVASFNLGNEQTNISNLGSLYNTQSNVFANQQNQMSDVRQNRDASTITNTQQIGQAKAQLKGAPSGWGAVLGGTLSGAASALGG